ncbi:MAG: hypothetical protein WDN69_29470 [Aliidongia sp.]
MAAVLAFSEGARADTMDMIDMGPLPGSAKFDLTTGISRIPRISQIEYQLDSEAKYTAGKFKYDHSHDATVASGSNYDWYYNFSMSSGFQNKKHLPAKFDLDLYGLSGSLLSNVEGFDLKDLNTGKVYHSKLVSAEGSDPAHLEIVAFLRTLTTSPGPTLGDGYQIQLEVSSACGRNCSYEMTGYVPIPGTAVLFASSILGMLGFEAARRRRVPAPLS